MPLSNKSPKRTTDKGTATKTRAKSPPKTEPAPLTPFVQPDASNEPTKQYASPLPSGVKQMHSLEESGIEHGLNFPRFSPNDYFAHDLFSVSSALPQMSKAQADEMVRQIEEQGQALRVAEANIGLNQQIVKAGIQYRKLEGMVVDYARVGVENGTKVIGYQTAGVNQLSAFVKHEQAREALAQQHHILTGMRGLTPLFPQEWAAKRDLKLSRIADLRNAVFQMNGKMNDDLNALSNQFQQDIEG
jgi:hypothetical protein